MPVNKKITKAALSKKSSQTARRFLKSCEEDIVEGNKKESTFSYFYKGKTVSITVKAG